MPQTAPPEKPVTPELAATVLMVRDGEAGLEIFMVRRNERSNVLGGAWVFPGGKVDAADAEDALHADLLDLPAHTLQQRLGEADLPAATAAALFVAAAREVFEECGVLFARSAHPLNGSTGTLPTQADRDTDFDTLLRAHGLRLSFDTFWPWSRWITPVRALFIQGRRFDTRFFVAALPHGQQARHDEQEAVDGRWFTPKAALTQYWEGQILLAPPQLMSLSHLSRYANTAAVLADAAARPPYCVQPEVFEVDGCRATAYPGDPLHPDRERIMPGPLRLVQRGARMEPPGGFEEF